jgi:two-component system response regulator NreC
MTEHAAASIVLADDHAVVRDGVRMLLEAVPGWQVVAECGDADAASRLVRDLRPDILVLDLLMPGRSSLDVLTELRHAHAGTRVVVLTMSDDPAIARAALAAGCAAFVLKESSATELVEAIRRALSGVSYLDPTIGALVVGTRAPATERALTPREIDVLRLIALGNTNAEIAEALSLSVRTVETHRSRILAKTGTKTRAQLVAYALGAGLLDGPLRAQHHPALPTRHEVRP